MSATNINEYISGFPDDIKKRLSAVRQIIRKNAPQAEEAITYGIPTFRLNGNLVHFAGYKKHIGFYPTPSVIDAFKERLSEFPSAKGSVQFPLSKPLPENLIADIVRFRVKENAEKK
jgi:uncharacterized protein YdhG (YjbR/CyaY superfamily)